MKKRESNLSSRTSTVVGTVIWFDQEKAVWQLCRLVYILTMDLAQIVRQEEKFANQIDFDD